MTSRAKKLRMPVALAFALFAPGSLSCSGNDACTTCSPVADAGLGDAGPSCAVADDPRLIDPRWECAVPL